MGLKYNLVSGLFAALVATFTKFGFAFGDDSPIATSLAPTLYRSLALPPSVLAPLLHLLFIALMLLSNALMLKFYVLSMHENGAAKATVYNFAINYLSSIALGAVVFGEQVSARLMIGVCLILSGTAMIGTC
jgi:drug/metabolite transporter (DMT)-like permease